jgi:hypothetical protein
VTERQEREALVAAIDRHHLETRPYVRRDVRVREHRALGLAGGARRVDDGRDLIGPDRGHPAAVRIGRGLARALARVQQRCEVGLTGGCIARLDRDHVPQRRQPAATAAIFSR